MVHHMHLYYNLCDDQSSEGTITMINEDILSTLDKCIKAHSNVERLINENSKQVLDLLEVLQDTAISVGEAIEQDYGVRQAAVFRLEEYCELLYQIHFRIEQGDYDPDEIKELIRGG